MTKSNCREMELNNALKEVMNDLSERHYCPECQVGLFKRQEATYYTWIEDELVVVPDFPCWVCDICGNRIWDQNAIFQLGMLLSPVAGSSSFDRVRPAAGAGEQENGAKKRKVRRSAI